MSLVNDMLRDLEGRRAAPNERLQLDGLHAVDEAGAARRETLARWRRGMIWLGAVILFGVLVGLMIGRLVEDRSPMAALEARKAAVQAPPAPAPVVAAPAPLPKVLDVLPQHDGRGLVLQLLLEKSVAYQRTEESGAVILRLPGMQLAGEAQQGREQRDGRSLSWRVENQGGDVQLMLVGLGDGLDVRDRLEQAGNRWLLWVEVPLVSPPSAGLPSTNTEELPVAAPAQSLEAPLPEWMNAPAASAPRPRAPEPVAPPASIPAPSGPPQVSIANSQPDALVRARQSMIAGDYASAIRLLEALQHQRVDDPEVTLWLARAYFSGGQQDRLLAWLPGQLARRPQDSELRVMLARAQLQSGNTRAAVATLEEKPPALSADPTYHALLAASYQQTGQWQQSANLYRRLVALRPDQATWQLGLGIALEQLDQDVEAASHYRLALQGTGLDDGSRRFASERAAALGGQR